ncbi:hypothetical protein GCM10010361_17880 [Streptomyces olivaceiscleroticus]|uniref:Uncharacterized protein n=2 Tax=Streptomyces olivaceiscleroticus TaxID=68245 RepID=A0ABP3JI40_9ACTN
MPHCDYKDLLRHVRDDGARTPRRHEVHRRARPASEQPDVEFIFFLDGSALWRDQSRVLQYDVVKALAQMVKESIGTPDERPYRCRACGMG